MLKETESIAPTKEKSTWKQAGGSLTFETKIWCGPNNKSIIPMGYQMPLWNILIIWPIGFQIKWNPDVKKYYWKPSFMVANGLLFMWYLSKYNPGKSLHGAKGHFPVPAGPFEVLIDFIQLPSSQNYKYVLVMVCIFSLWVETFPCRQVTAMAAGKNLLEKKLCHRGESPAYFTMTGELPLLARLFKISVKFGPYFNISMCLLSLVLRPGGEAQWNN